MRTLRPNFWLPAVALIGIAACSRSDQPSMDDELKRDLAAVRSAPSAQVVVSPLEAGVAPAPKARNVSPQPTRSPAKRVATLRPPSPSRAPSPAPASHETVDAAPSAEPAPAPAPAAQRPAPAKAEEPRRGPYKTEAEIFRQMPWIRP